MRRALALASAAAATLAITACSSGTDNSDETVTPTPATVEQFASAVARNEASIRNIAEERSDCFLDVILRDSQELAASCITDAVEGRSALIAIKDSFNRLGDPPAEIDDLVQRMIRGGEYIETTDGFDVEAECEDPESDDCAVSVETVMQSLKEAIVPELDAWGPYL